MGPGCAAGRWRVPDVLRVFAVWAGPGGETAVPVAGGEDLLVYHAYDPVSGKPSLQLSTMKWKDGWPVVGLAAE